jgi:hypothetical protein
MVPRPVLRRPRQWGGVQVSSPVRRHQKGRVYTPAPHVANACATHPGTPQNICLRGGEEVVAMGGSARLDVARMATS